MATRAVDLMTQEQVYKTMEGYKIKVFGSFERCKDRLHRFLMHNGSKIVHVETIPITDYEDKKIIHVEVNTIDVINVPETDNDCDADSTLDYYRRMFVSSDMESDTDTLLDSYRRVLKDLMNKNGFNSYKIFGECSLQDD